MYPPISVDTVAQMTTLEPSSDLPDSDFTLDDFPPNGCTNPTMPARLCEPCLRLREIYTEKDNQDPSEFERIRTATKEKMNDHHDPFIRLLPPELSSDIFVLYVESFNSDFDFTEYPRTTQGGPLLLSAVSKSWRAIAFGTPQLWATVNIVVYYLYTVPRLAELVQQWLQRSGELLLSISLVYEGWDNQDSIALSPLFDVIRAYSPRWSVLALILSSVHYFAFIGDLVCAPNLSTLRLIPNSTIFPERFEIPETPSLQHLETTSLLISDMMIQWENLTSFETNSLSIDEFFQVLRRAGKLTHFKVGCLSGDVNLFPLPNTPLTHDALKTLYLSFDYDDSIARLDLAILPSLTKFTYEHSLSSTFPLVVLLSFIRCSQCKLTHFSLLGPHKGITIQDFFQLLSNMPTVTHLKIQDFGGPQLVGEAIMTDTLLEKLTSDAVNTGLLPLLQSLKFYGFKTFAWTSLANFVEGGPPKDYVDIDSNKSSAHNFTSSPLLFSQSKDRYKIRRISFRLLFDGFSEAIDPDSLARLQQARDAGVSIAIVDEDIPHLPQNILSE